MIERLSGRAPKRLDESYYMRKILANYRAYGTDYDFASFYEGENIAVSVFNGNMTICASEGADTGELEEFIRFSLPYEIELPYEVSKRMELYGYKADNRTLFRFEKGEYSDDTKIDDNPKLDGVFDILKTGFSLDGLYDEWLTDTSHRIRHGVSRFYRYENTVAGMLFEDSGICFFGQIATLPSDRGKGHARRLLRKLYDEIGGECQLFARDERVSFYKSIGFTEIYTDRIYTLEN